MQITPLGDSAIVVRLRERLDDAPEETLSAVLAAQHHLEAAQLPGVIEIAPAYITVAVFYDPVSAVKAGAPPDDVFGWYEQKIHQALPTARSPGATRGPAGEENGRDCIEIPVCYEAEFAPDLDDVARGAGATRQEVIELHSATEYRVHCVGFTAAFPFLGGLDPRLATSRRATPRKEIPAGSVGIGGAQTGIYPVKSPGGWNIIGRTPLRLFDPHKNPPALLRAGDRVRFRTITRAQFEGFTK